MRIRSIAVVALLVGSLGFAAGRAFTEEDPASEMAEWMKLGTPGEEHKVLAVMVGEWDVDGKHWMSGQESPMKGTSKATSLFDGRYVREEFRSEFQGMPFQGISHLGFDNATRKYVGTWIDSMSTAIMSMTGTYDAATKTFDWQSTMTGPGGKEHKGHMILKVISDKETVATMFRVGAEGEQKEMELRYRKK